MKLIDKRKEKCEGMKRVFALIVILISLVGCGKETGEETLTATKVPTYAENGATISPTPKEDIKPDSNDVSNLDTMIQSVTPYSIFDVEKEISVGDVVVMGNYSHGDKDDGGYPYLPVQWLVLEKKGSEVLLLSLYGIDTEPYYDLSNTGESDIPESVFWGNSTLHKWLNTFFLQSAFMKTEQDCIQQVTIRTHSNSTYGTSGGGETQDFLFLLSEEEVKQYFDTEAKRITHTVPKVEHGYGMFGEEPSDNFFDGWWLRTSGKDAEHTVYVNELGQVVTDGTYIFSGHIAVRPAMWVDLEKIKKISEEFCSADMLNKEENIAIYEDREAYQEVLNTLWELNKGETSEATMKAVEISLGEIIENRLYDNWSHALPFSEDSMDKIRELGKLWSGCDKNGFIQQRGYLSLFKYNASLHTQFTVSEQYWETPERGNQYIPRNFTIERIVGTNHICSVNWEGHIRSEEEKTELLRQVNYVTKLLGMETEIILEDDSYYYDGIEFRVSISKDSSLGNNELGEYYYVRIY